MRQYTACVRKDQFPEKYYRQNVNCNDVFMYASSKCISSTFGSYDDCYLHSYPHKNIAKLDLQSDNIHSSDISSNIETHKGMIFISQPF